MRKNTILMLMGLACLATKCPEQDSDNPNLSTGGVIDNTPVAVAALVEVPNPLVPDNPRFPLVPSAAPAPGLTIIDQRLGTKQTRVVAGEGLRHEYSRFDPFNRDASLILLTRPSTGDWIVCRTGSIPYDQDANRVRTIDQAEPRWDPADADMIWGLVGFQILNVNVQTGQTTTVKDFTTDPTISPLLAAHPDLYRITTREEGEPSMDKRYWAFMLQGTAEDYRPRYVFTWDRQQDRVLGVFVVQPEASRIDWVGMSPNGNWVLFGNDWDNGGSMAGMLMADRELKTFHRLDYDAGHSDVGLDSQGNEIIVLQSNRTDSIDMVALSLAARPVDTGGSYENTGRVQLIRLFYDSASPLGLSSGVHISCNAPGWCVVSTFTEPGRPEQNWLDRTIALVRLDRTRPQVFYLGKVYGTSGTYWEETQATIAGNGSRVVWATNWGNNVGQGRVWLMQVSLPAGWMEALAGRP